MVTLAGGWTLVARLSNIDAARWTGDKSWWVDKYTSEGDVLSPTSKGDMISEAFWMVFGDQVLVTNASTVNESLLLTMSQCLSGKPLRSIFSECKQSITSPYSECRAVGSWQPGCQHSTLEMCVIKDDGSRSRMSIPCGTSESTVNLGGGSLNKDFEVDINGAIDAPTDYSVNIWVR